MKPAPAKILFIAASGIGNTILATPLMQRARELWPQARIDLLTSRKVFQSPLAHANLIAGFFDLERSAISTLSRLRGERYDLSLNCFPSNRWQFNLVASIIGANTRVTHSYPEGNRFYGLMNHLVPVDESLHDIEQNLRLLDQITETKNFSISPAIFATRPDDDRRAQEWIEKQRIEKIPLIGVHIGGVNVRKKWLMNRRLGAMKMPRAEDLRRDLNEFPSDAAILFFGGAEEESSIQDFIQSLPKDVHSRCHRFCADLWTAAALVRRCQFFLSGDTGLMHIAAVFGIPQKAFFMTTNPNRTAPRNTKAVLVVEKGCASYRYPFSLKRETE